MRTQILALSENPEYAYLADLVDRQDIDWQHLLLSEQEWHHREQGLTPAGAAILSVALAIATGPQGALAVNTGMTGTLSNAAFSTLVNQATISLINNGGDIKKTLKELGSKQNVKGLVFAITSAGVASKLDGALLKNIDLSDEASFSHRLIKNMAHSTSNALLESAVYGTSLEKALEKNLKLALIDTSTSEAFQSLVKPIDKDGGIDALARNLAHKIAAGLTGCLSAHLSSQDCEAGALGAMVGELWGDYRNNYLNTSDEQVKQQLINEAKLIAAITAALAEQDPATAAKMAGEAVRWNVVFSKRKEKYEPEDIPNILNDVEKLKTVSKSLGLDFAHDALNHYVSGNGAVFDVDSNFLLGYSSVREAVETNQNRFLNHKDGITKYLSGIIYGAPSSFRMHFDRNLYADTVGEIDLFCGSGGSSITSFGSFSGERDGQNIYIKGNIHVSWTDRYDWDSNKEVKMYLFTLDDKRFKYLEEQGHAKSFDMRSSWDYDFSGTYNEKTKKWSNIKWVKR